MLKTRLFRNLGDQKISFPPEGVAVIGGNAQGKSNLLEAIYYLETFRSFRGARLEHLITFGEDVFRIAGEVVSENGVGGSSTEVAAAYEASSRRRRVTIDGAEPERIGDAIGRLGAVIFSPGDVGIVNEGPVRRRRFLDVALSLNEKGYLVALQAFRHALAQRNAALRANQVEAVVRAWDEPLARSGATVMGARHRWVSEWRDAFRGYYEAVSGGDSATMTYTPKVSVEDWEDDGIYQAYQDTLDARWAVDLRRQSTSTGPHRDELLLTLVEGENEVEVREFGSGGQRRTVALALRLIEGDAIRKAKNSAPVLLLDDAFAELDDARRERVFGLMGQDRFGQVIITAPKESDVPLQGDTLPRWGIREGRICA
ncbi:MAG: DNA replication/repair protein RecF [Gemmatimonadetes bacterium]|nr:DNA replication/repair protein RecF [Gemmatimonadota bacterium]